MLIFALDSSSVWGERVASELQVTLGRHEERDFEDGEHKIRPLENVRGQEVFVIQSLYSDGGQSVNDKLCRLLFFIGALRDASAGSITAVIPYFAYARKDRKTKTRDPVTMKYMAQLLEALGTDHLLTMDIHNLAAFQNAFRIPTDHLEARVLFAPVLADLVGPASLVVVSPDAGGVKRAEQCREPLEQLTGRRIGKAFIEKKRSMGQVSGDTLVGEVVGCTAVIVDDLVSSGTTISRAVAMLKSAGAERVFACVTHGIFVGEAEAALNSPGLEKLLVTDTIPPFRLAPQVVESRLLQISAAPLFATAIRQIHECGSITGLLAGSSGSSP